MAFNEQRLKIDGHLIRGSIARDGFIKTHFRAKRQFSHALPEEFAHNDFRLSEPVLELLIEKFTKPGDVIFDPFAGFATTLLLAQKLNRIGFGVENYVARFNYGRKLLSNPLNLICDDARSVPLAQFPGFALSISSPIYMHKHETRDPLTGFSCTGTYEKYLADLTEIYVRVGEKLLPGGTLVIEAANLKDPNGVTTFAWDLAKSLADHLTYQGEIVLIWEDYGFGYDHSYCLVFNTDLALA